MCIRKRARRWRSDYYNLKLDDYVKINTPNYCNRMHKRKHTTAYLRDFQKTLLSDVREAWKEMQNDDTPFRRRSYIRAVFTLVEGFIYAIKHDILLEFEENPSSFSPAGVNTRKFSSISFFST